MKRGEYGPMKRTCRFYPDDILRALAHSAEACKKYFPEMNRKTRRTLIKYHRMYLKGTLRHVI